MAQAKLSFYKSKRGDSSPKAQANEVRPLEATLPEDEPLIAIAFCY
jgi:hypothetical protein